MGVLRVIKSDYTFYYHTGFEAFVALDSDNNKKLIDYMKSIRGKQKTPPHSVKIEGFKLINDEEFQSLKIDFSKSFQFKPEELEKTKLE